MGRGNQYIQLFKVLHCKLQTINKQLPTFPLKVRGLNHRHHRWEASVLPLHHCGPLFICSNCRSTNKTKPQEVTAKYDGDNFPQKGVLPEGHFSTPS